MYAGHLIHKWSISAQTLMGWGWGVNWNEKTWDKSLILLYVAVNIIKFGLNQGS